MSKIMHTPEGVRDIAPFELDRKLDTAAKLLDVIKQAGFSLMQTPSFEYFDVFAKNIGLTPSNELYKFYDKEGNTLVLRPDFTPALARAYSKMDHDDQSSLGLCYCGNTFVNGNDLNGVLKESTEIGAELYNDASSKADASIISLVVKCMKTAGFDRFVVSIGNGNFFKGLFEETGMSEEDELALRELISSGNYHKAEDLLLGIDIDDDLKRLIVHISDDYNDKASLYELKGRISNEKSTAALCRLIEILDILENEGIADHVSVDLGLLNKYN